jgi:hypothetical protein
MAWPKQRIVGQSGQAWPGQAWPGQAPWSTGLANRKPRKMRRTLVLLQMKHTPTPVLLVDGTAPYLSIAQKILLQDISVTDFHAHWPELYEVAQSEDGLAAVSTRFPRRLVGRFGVRINQKRLWVPMLVDTGAQVTIFSLRTLKHFGFRDSIPSAFSASIGHVQCDVAVCPADTHFEHLNILGMDVLEHAISNWPYALWHLLEGGLRLTAADVAVDDSFALLPDEMLLAEVIQRFAGEKGFTQEDSASVIAVLAAAWLQTVGHLRWLSRASIQGLGLPITVVELLLRVKGPTGSGAKTWAPSSYS